MGEYSKKALETSNSLHPSIEENNQQEKSIEDKRPVTNKFLALQRLAEKSTKVQAKRTDVIQRKLYTTDKHDLSETVFIHQDISNQITLRANDDKIKWSNDSTKERRLLELESNLTSNSENKRTSRKDDYVRYVLQTEGVITNVPSSPEERELDERDLKEIKREVKNVEKRKDLTKQLGSISKDLTSAKELADERLETLKAIDKIGLKNCFKILVVLGVSAGISKLISEIVAFYGVFEGATAEVWEAKWNIWLEVLNGIIALVTALIVKWEDDGNKTKIAVAGAAVSFAVGKGLLTKFGSHLVDAPPTLGTWFAGVAVLLGLGIGGFMATKKIYDFYKSASKQLPDLQKLIKKAE